MKEESLNKAIKIIVEALLNSDIEETDKLELAMNIMQLLNNYDRDMRILQEQNKDRMLRR